MIDLQDLTVIIPLKIDSIDRAKNCFVTVSYLLNNFNCTVLLKEVDGSKKFPFAVLPKIEKYTDANNIKRLNYIFEQTIDPVFYRMKIINEMLSMSDTKVVANYDVDILLKKDVMKQSVETILFADADVVYPYGVPNFQNRVHLNDDKAERFVSSGYDFKLLDNDYRTEKCEPSFAGHVQFFNRDSYISGGMENENFKGSAPEDIERLFRFQTLGYNVVRLSHYVYHMEHFRGADSYPQSISGNPYYYQNIKLMQRLEKMTLDEYREYYSSQEYLKKYVKK